MGEVLLLTDTRKLKVKLRYVWSVCLFICLFFCLLVCLTSLGEGYGSRFG